MSMLSMTTQTEDWESEAYPVELQVGHEYRQIAKGESRRNQKERSVQRTAELASLTWSHRII